MYTMNFRTITLIIAALVVLLVVFVLTLPRPQVELLGRSTLPRARAVHRTPSRARRALTRREATRKTTAMTRMNDWRDNKRGRPDAVKDADKINPNELSDFLDAVNTEIARCGFETDFSWDRTDGAIDEIYDIGDYLERCDV
tara:strand:+ start:1268 stop:1693 length:426 start_codon:yes stop_codon:yes gene_type:complete